MVCGIKFMTFIAIVVAQGFVGDNFVTSEVVSGYDGPIGIGPFQFNYRNPQNMKRRYSAAALYNMFHNN